MKIILAKKIGFCFGVKKSVEKVFKALEKEKDVFTFGPLIHNNQFVKRLEDMGVRVINETKKVKKGSIVIIRAHGLPPTTKKEIEKMGAEVIDGTCPKVLLLHVLARKLEKEGKKVIIIGDGNHPEVIGVKGNLKNGIVLDSVQEVEKLDDFDDVGVLVKTTEEVEKFKEISKALKNKFKKIIIHNTICDATDERQSEAKKVAKLSDVMIVVGGKHSSNTLHLVDVCKKQTTTYQIETKDDINERWFEEAKTVGITTGASVPDYIVEEILEKLKNIK